MEHLKNKFKCDLFFYFVLFLFLVYSLWCGEHRTRFFGFSNSANFSMLSLFGVFFFYKNFYFYKNTVSFPDSKRIVLLVMPIVLLLSLVPVFGSDLVTYVAEAKGLVVYHNNPFTTSTLPILVSDPWFAHFKDNPWLEMTTVYGPLSVLFVSLFVLLGFKSFLAAIILYKIALGCLFIVSVFLFHQITRNLQLTFLYAFNPVILFSTLVSGHNDFLILFFLLLSLYCLNKSKHARASLLFALSAVVKYTSIILWPLYFFKRGRLNPLRTAVAIFILLAVFFFFFGLFHFPFAEAYKRLALQNHIGCFGRCTPVVYLSEKVWLAHAVVLRAVSSVLLGIYVIYRYLIRNVNEAKYIFWSYFVLLFVYLEPVTPWYFVQMIPFGLIAAKDKKYYYLTFAITVYVLTLFVFNS